MLKWLTWSLPASLSGQRTRVSQVDPAARFLGRGEGVGNPCQSRVLRKEKHSAAAFGINTHTGEGSGVNAH